MKVSLVPSQLANPVADKGKSDLMECLKSRFRTQAESSKRKQLPFDRAGSPRTHPDELRASGHLSFVGYACLAVSEPRKGTPPRLRSESVLSASSCGPGSLPSFVKRLSACHEALVLVVQLVRVLYFVLLRKSQRSALVESGS